MRYVRCAGLLVAAALLVGCQTGVRKPAEPLGWDARRAELERQDRYGLSGRVAVAAGAEGFNAHMSWMQEGERSQVVLNGPFGAGAVRIELNGSQVTVRDRDGRVLQNAEARDEIHARLGFEPPFASLRYWLRGIPDPASRAGVLLDTDQRLTHLLQEDWLIDYTEYGTTAGRELPRKLTLKHGDVRVRLLIEQWQP